MKTRAVVFVTDAGFLVPSLVAAEQVAAQPDVAAIAEIIVVAIDFAEAELDTLRAEWPDGRIVLAALPSATFLPPDTTFFNPTHIPRTALGRFALQHALPPHIEHVVYLDGDVMIVGDIAPLVAHDVPEGCILAANDYLWLCADDHGKFWPRHRSYLDALALPDPRDYFNSGVLAFTMATWREKAPQALAYFVEHAEAALYHDQSALNAVFRGRREVLSPRYNFITNFAEFGLAREIEPAIIHFTGGGKPWFYDGPPWHGRFRTAYGEFLERHPALRPRLAAPPPEAIASTARTYRRRELKSRLLTPWRQLKRKTLFRRYLDETTFAPAP